MKEQVIKTFFSLLNIAVFNSANENIEKDAFNDDFVKALFSLAKKHDLAHLIAHTIIKNKLVSEQNPLYKKILSEQFLALSRSENNIYAKDSLCEILEKESFKHIPLKGSVINSYYPEKWMRTSCDIDVLVEREKVDVIVELLKGKGYSSGEIKTNHDYAFTAPNGVRLELHYSLAEEGQFIEAEKILADAFNYAKKVGEKEFELTLDENFAVFYHIVHMAKHFLHGGCGIKPFLDLYIMLRKGVFEEDNLLKFLQKTSLTNFYNAVKEVIGVWFENKEHTQLTLNIQNYILTGGVYGTVQNYAVVNSTKGKGKVKTFLSIMFLPKKNLEVIYPNLKKHPILFPFYQVKRWFKVFNKKSRTNAKSQISASASVTNAEKENLAKLLKDLGI